MNRHCIALLGLSALLTALPAAAHHSFAMFDNKKEQTLVGTVKEFQWTNPHCFIQLLVPGENGAAEWSVELGSTAALYRMGWRANAFRPGDKITIVIHPTRDGTAGGAFLSAVAADGKPLGPHT
ncbi:MAG: DUF6152 family protein [Steroidobacteraceae bacterium]